VTVWSGGQARMRSQTAATRGARAAANSFPRDPSFARNAAHTASGAGPADN